MSDAVNSMKCESCGAETSTRSWSTVDPKWRCQECVQRKIDTYDPDRAASETIATLTRERDAAVKRWEEAVGESRYLALMVERDRLKAALATIASHVGAAVSPECSVEFLCHVPDEVRLTMAQIMKRAEKAEGDARWVPCSERMPKNNTAVMVCCPSANDDDGEGTFVASGFVLPDGEWQSQDSIQKSHPILWPVTHWRPLPGPPKPHTEPTP